MKKQRQWRTSEQKVLILKEHLVEGVPVSEICEREGLNPNMFYKWQKQFFEQGFRVFEREPKSINKDRNSERVSRLERKVQQKDEVIGELLAEHVALKKSISGDL
jgi:transposase-like protein